MTVNRTAAWLSFAQVMAHCGDDPGEALRYIAGAIASEPTDPQAYDTLAELWAARREDLEEMFRSADSLQAVLAHSYVSFLESNMDTAVMALGAVVGVQPTVAWAAAPWFQDSRFQEAVSANALAEAVMRTMDHGRDLGTAEVLAGLQPWFDVIDVVCAREPRPEAMARMAIFLRACGRTDASFELCDRADAAEPIMLTEVVRAGTWRKVGKPDETMAAFRRALALEPANWSLFLDMADVAGEQQDFAHAVQLIEQGLEHEPAELTLRAARAAYRARLAGEAGDLRELIELVPQLPQDSYRGLLVDLACAGPGLPAELVAEAHKVRIGA